MINLVDKVPHSIAITAQLKEEADLVRYKEYS